MTPASGCVHRRSGLAALAVVLFTGLALLCIVAPGARAALPAYFYGMQWSGYYSDHNNAADMEALRRSGAKILRVGFSKEWAKRGTPEAWNVYNSVFTQAWENGITILPYLYEGKYPVTIEELAEWEAWVSEFYAHYGDEGEFWKGKENPNPPIAWEVWNEPNFGANGVNGTTANPEKYTDFLRRTAEVIRSGPGNPKILLGGLYWNAETGWDSSGKYNYSGAQFLRLVKYYGGAKYFDGLSIHPYAFFGTNATKLEKVEGFVKEASKILAEEFPVEGKKLWVTEIGWPLQWGDSGHPVVSEADQKQLLSSLLGWLATEYENQGIEAVQWYAYKDISVNSWAYHAGVRQLNGAYRSAWWAYLSKTGAPTWPYSQSTTTTTVQIVQTLHGTPGFATVGGEVKPSAGVPAVNEGYADLEFYKYEGGWKLNRTIYAPISNGHFEVKNQEVGKGLWKVHANFREQGRYLPSGSGEPQFEIKSGYRFRFRHSGKCLSETGYYNSEAVIQYPCSSTPWSGDGQTFRFVPIEGSYYMIQFGWSGRCLDVYGNNPSDGGLIDQYDCIGATNQQWWLIPISGQPGWYALYVRHSGKCLDVPGSSQQNVQLIQYTCYWTGNQQGEIQTIN